MSDNLKRLFITFGGDTKKMGWFARQFPTTKEFVEAVEAAEWKIGRLEKLLAAKRQTTIDASEQLLQGGEAARKLKAIGDAKERIKAASVGHAKAKALLVGWFELNGEYQARGYDNPDAAPVDLSFLEMGTSSKVGDAAVLKQKAFSEELLEKEPLMIFSGKVSTFLATARQCLADIQAKAGVLHSYKDSLAEVQRVIAEAEKLSQRVAEIFARSAPKARPMAFAEQNMVPQAKDLKDVQHKLSDVSGIRTPSQAWALAGAETKGQEQQPLYRAKAIDRLKELNGKWGTGYKVEQLDAIMNFLVSGRITTNYFLSAAPGANLEKGDDSGPKPTPLVELLMGSANFKNLWEIGKSQASADKGQRGGVEEPMGYSAALNRTSGTPHTRTQTGDAKFAPQDEGEMPKYAAVTSGSQKDGVGPRYGKSFVVWKESLRERVTHTPGDSWNMLEQGVGFLTSGKHPEIIFANAEEPLVRLAAAEATGSDTAWLKKVTAEGLSVDSYIETQIHGDLTWDDVAEIQVGEDDADTVVQQLKDFAKQKGYGFTVTKK